MSTHLYPEVAAHVMRVSETVGWNGRTGPILSLQKQYEMNSRSLRIPDVLGVGIDWNDEVVAANQADLLQGHDEKPSKPQGPRWWRRRRVTPRQSSVDFDSPFGGSIPPAPAIPFRCETNKLDQELRRVLIDSMSRHVAKIPVCFQGLPIFAGGSTRHRRDMKCKPEARSSTLEIVSKA